MAAPVAPQNQAPAAAAAQPPPPHLPPALQSKQPSPPPPYTRPALRPKSPFITLTPWQGLKRAVLGDGSGRVLWPHSIWQVLAMFFAELMGTFMLLFLGCLGVRKPLGGSLGEVMHLQGGLVFGMVVGMQITTFGHTSMAHLNPAVTLCSLMLGKIRITTALVYFVAEMIGAVLGTGALMLITPSDNSCCEFCVTKPHQDLGVWGACAMEFVITAMLIFVVNGVWDQRHSSSFDAIPLKFTITISGLALAAGGWTGASMNPARSFGPALWELDFESHWVYWVGPMFGSAFATLYYMYLLNSERVHKKVDAAEEVGLTAIKNDTGIRQEE